MRTPLPVLLLIGACSSAPPVDPPPGPATDGARPQVEPATPQVVLSPDDPLSGCKSAEVGPSATWTCGPHRIVLARYPDGLPPEQPGTWRTDAPTRTPVSVEAGGRTLEGVALTQPGDGDHLTTVILRDEAGARIASCALQVANGQDADGLTRWCVAALGQVLTQP